MTAVDILAAGAVSPLGSGPDAWWIGNAGERAPSAVREVPWFREAGLRRPVAAMALGRRSAHGDSSVDPAVELLARAVEQLTRTLDTQWPAWRRLRIGLALGTSGGGMCSLTESFERRDRGERLTPELASLCPYFGPFRALSNSLRVPLVAKTQILTACASSTLAMGLACRWLELGAVDLVLAGGYDALSIFVAAGFESLAATTADRPRPFCRERDGLALGEGAAIVALARRGSAPLRPMGSIAGFGASADAVHVTAPDRRGDGVARAASIALREARLSPREVDLVSAHGTATLYNDAAEANALRAVLGEHRPDVALHPFKAAVGHMLGAAGVIESLAALQAMRSSVRPATAAPGSVEPYVPAALLSTNAAGSSRWCLKLSSAFGGANAALVFADSSWVGRPSGVRPVHLVAVGEPCVTPDPEAALAAGCRVDRGQLLRCDPVSALVVSAAASVVSRIAGGEPDRTGVIVGSAATTLEVNDKFDARRRIRGVTAVEPRRFPATSPNLCAGQCGIVFGLRGPSLAVGAGAAASVEALVVAHDLIASGDADTLVVVAVDDVGATVRELWESADWPVPTHGARAVVLAAAASGPALDRSRLSLAHTQAERDRGILAGEGPGWPALGPALQAAS